MYAPDYNIPLPDGRNIALLFNNWTARIYCERHGIELEDLHNRLASGEFLLRLKEIPTLLLIAAQSYARFNRKEFTADEVDAETWALVMGGVNYATLSTLTWLFMAGVAGTTVENLKKTMELKKVQVEPSETAKATSAKKKKGSRGNSFTKAAAGQG